MPVVALQLALLAQLANFVGVLVSKLHARQVSGVKMISKPTAFLANTWIQQLPKLILVSVIIVRLDTLVCSRT